MTLKKRLEQPAVSDKDWARVIKSRRRSVRELAAAHPAAPDEVLKALSWHRDDYFSDEAFLVVSRELSAELQGFFFDKLKNKYPDDSASEAFFANPSLKPRLIRKLLLEAVHSHEQYGILPALEAVALSPLVAQGLGDTVLELLHRDPELNVTAKLAANPHAPVELLLKMLKTFKNSFRPYSGRVFSNLLSNPNLPISAYENYYFKTLPTGAREKVLDGLSARMRAKALEVGLEGTVGDVLVAAGKAAPGLFVSVPAWFRGKAESKQTDVDALKVRFDEADRNLSVLVSSISLEMREEIEGVLEEFEEAFLDQIELYRNVLSMRASDSTRRAARAARAQALRLVEEYEKLADSLVGLSVIDKSNLIESLESLRFRSDAYQGLLEREAAGNPLR